MVRVGMGGVVVVELPSVVALVGLVGALVGRVITLVVLLGVSFFLLLFPTSQDSSSCCTLAAT